jgi:nucleotide-binding universal stress UspA family protein
MKPSPPQKRPKGKRRELAPLEPIDAIDGPKMKALPTDRHRAFVRALYEVRPGFGAGVKSAKLAGFGSETSSAQSMATIASRLMHDERVLDAIREEDEKRIRASAPRAIRALSHLIETPTHRDHGRAIGMVLDRVHPTETLVKVQHDATPALKATAEVLANIAKLAASVGLDVAKMPPLLDVTPNRVAEKAT